MLTLDFLILKKICHPTENRKMCECRFWGRLLRVSYQIFIIQNSGFKMAIAKTKKHYDIQKNKYSGVFGVAGNEFIRFS